MLDKAVTYFAISTSGSYEGAAAVGMMLLFTTIFFGLVILVLSPALILAALIRRRAEHVLNERQTSIITQFDPPRDLSPAEVGLLYDMKCDEKELMATLFHLEQRGIIAITSSDSVKIVNDDAYANLAKYEKLAIKAAKGETETLRLPKESHINYVNPNTGQLELSVPNFLSRKGRLAFTLAVQESIEQKGIRMNNYQSAFTLRVLVLWFLIGLWPLVFAATPGTSDGVTHSAWSIESLVVSFFAIIFMGMFLFPAYIIAACLVVWIWTKVAGRYWLNTKQARAIWPELEGYRRYLKQVDLGHIQFESTSGIDPVTKTLPYAIVFGLDTKWQQRLNHGKNEQNH